MKKVLIILLCGSMLIGTLSCSNQKNNQEPLKESFSWGTTLNDGRYVSFAIEVPYLKNENSSLFDALSNEEITIEEVLKKLELVETLRDGGSKIYHYNKLNKEFGNNSFFLIACNSVDNIKDVFIARDKNSLLDKCHIKINDLENVSMSIKEGTLTKKSATVIIKDTSDRDNIYGADYELQIYDDGNWKYLKPKNELAFISIGYKVNEDHILELKVDWRYHYGTLKKGKYRILKSTSTPGEGTEHYLTTEFTID